MAQNIEKLDNNNLQASKIIPIKKFVVYTIFTLGFYLFYWNYIMWKNVKEEKILNILPIMRTIFFVLFSGSLARHVLGMSKQKGYTKSINSVLVFTLCFLGSIITKKAPGAFFLLGWYVIALAFIPVLQAYNFYWEQKEPHLKANEKFSPAGISVIVLGGMLTLLVLIGSILPDEKDNTTETNTQITDDNE